MLHPDHALGRKLTENDSRALDAIVEQTAQNQYRFSSVVSAIVQSAPFQRAWGEPSESLETSKGN